MATRVRAIDPTKTALLLYKAAFDLGDARRAAELFIGEHFTQHNSYVADGKAAFIEHFETLVRRWPQRLLHILFTFRDHNIVYVHARQDLEDAEGTHETWVTMDFFLLDAEDRVIEHWDVLDQRPPATRCRMSRAGAGDTEANKRLVRRYLEDVRRGGGPDNTFAARGIIRPLAAGTVLEAIIHLVGDGAWVATLCKVRVDDVVCALAERFRVVDGQIVAHHKLLERVRTDAPNAGKF